MTAALTLIVAGLLWEWVKMMVFDQDFFTEEPNARAYQKAK